MSAPLDELEAILDYRFRNREMLSRALTHKSRIAESGPADGLHDNERFEFLGDAILGFLVSEFLLHNQPEAQEGDLSKLKSRLVSSAHLLSVARTLDLGRFLILGRGEEMSGGREKRALLADAVEALMAAIYLDGGVEAVRRFVAQWVTDGEILDGEARPVTDYKSALQEMTQALKLPQPRYSIVEERGPEHAKTFLVEVRVGRDLAHRAEGLSKKSAGQDAARLVFEQLKERES